VAETIRAVLPKLTRKTDRRFLADMLHRHERALTQVVEAYTHDVERHTPIHPEYAAAELDGLAADDAIFTSDTGMCNVWTARYITPNGRRRILGSFKHGSMANALPHAIGAQLAAPDRQVIAMAGDGGLAMLLGELLTLKTHRLPVKVVVFNNSSLGMVKLGRDRRGTSPSRAGAARPGHRPECAIDTAEHHCGGGPGLRLGGEPHRAGRRGWQDVTAGAVQPAQHPSALAGDHMITDALPLSRRGLAP
jgi:thiamine pyrophosphate-dependent acetolactate synthase large subunit-like protein